MSALQMQFSHCAVHNTLEMRFTRLDWGGMTYIMFITRTVMRAYDISA